YEAIDQPGAGQMQYGRRLLESRPFLTRVPDDSIIVTDRVPTSVPGAGRYRFVGTRDSEGSYAMVYAPIGRAFKVRMDAIQGPKVKAWWYNPRNGQATAIGEFANTGEREFLPPEKGEMIDWVLVLDDASKNFPAPGVR
ncbi:MAG: putative collagen-binding domain-containing protein, partial [Solirubrobacterales bacterium]